MTENIDISSHDKHIVFIGFMGAGKTTIGQLVAKKLHRDFIDIDHEIERIHQMPVSAIFQELGEASFRKMERELIVALCSETRSKILSLGGGAYMQEEVRKACLANCIVFFIDVSWDSWKERIPLLIDTRPILQNKTLDQIEELFLSRQSTYAMSHYTISSSDMDAETAANQIVESLKQA
ncbi:shikimate kinase [Brevibacillus reuszeri]|uniref:Shikimate kinase n=1 Tax=Brevibacillus reuszeri TaxID=54915 RepID=A0A0K9YRA9_9BACL|nr:shikimate kinase [Brevibacillus reuszeri]KNB71258.1 shikimate kinase [Brevibacillus reuszeri]MED1857696.1 shikimate kinase [Brevibacillus reuszeri]GED66471.1 shikimate kinase [Brevibacillus reuszeri]